jgi:hypothetical protein
MSLRSRAVSQPGGIQDESGVVVLVVGSVTVGSAVSLELEVSPALLPAWAATAMTSAARTANIRTESTAFPTAQGLSLRVSGFCWASPSTAPNEGELS